MITIPPYLKKGDTIGITCPSGYLAASNVKDCISTLQSWGYEVMVGKTVGSDSQNYFSASDEDKIAELQAMLDDASIHAILFGRGGYGMTRIIDKLNFNRFKRNPKWLMGFSDITAMHCHVLSNFQIASIHGPMASAFKPKSASIENIESLHRIITGKKIKYAFESHLLNIKGKSSGNLVGGNLTLLANTIGTRSEIDTKNNILFIEDIGEYLYSIDRLLYQLKRSGKLKNLKGLLIGGFTDMKDTERPFGKTIYQLIAEAIGEVSYPVCYNFPVSHGKENLALKIGVEYELNVTSQKTTLKEI